MRVLQTGYKISSKQLPHLIWNDECHSLKIARTTISFTGMEYRLLASLRDGSPVPYPVLVRLIYNRELDGNARTMMDKLIDRIRGKLRGTGIYIYCVLGYGYFLLPEIPPAEDL